MFIVSDKYNFALSDKKKVKDLTLEQKLSIGF